MLIRTSPFSDAQGMADELISLAGTGAWITKLEPSEALTRRGVRLWLVTLDQPEVILEQLERLLGADESLRAGRFVVRQARTAFVVCRAALRMLLGHALGVDPRDIRFAYTEKGKPFLVGSAVPLHFNVSHSGELALIAASADGQVGVDIEAIQDRPDLHQAARTFLAPAEQAFLEHMAWPERSRAFYRVWTRKEAVLKAAGQGITSGLRAPDVSHAAADPNAAEGVWLEYARGTWLVFGFEPNPGYEAAVAVQSAP